MHSARIRSHQCKVLWSHLSVLNAKQLFTLRTSSGSSEPLTWYHHDHSGLSCQSEKSKNLRIFIMLHQSIFVVIPRRLWRSESEANLQPDVELHHGSEVCEPIGSIAQFGLQGLQGSWRKKEIFLHKRGCKKNFVVFYVSSFSLSLSLSCIHSQLEHFLKFLSLLVWSRKYINTPSAEVHVMAVGAGSLRVPVLVRLLGSHLLHQTFASFASSFLLESKWGEQEMKKDKKGRQ